MSTDPQVPASSEVSLPPQRTLIEVTYPEAKGTLGLRGNPPLSWEHTAPPTVREGDRHVFAVDVPPGEVLEMKIVRNEESWETGPNYAVHAGEHFHVEPYFERSTCTLLPPETLNAAGMQLTFQVLLPPSYDEQTNKRYPVIYVQDGQALWSTSSDPFGVWHLDTTLDELYALGALQELIVVALYADEQRIERLSPVPDSKYGGGKANQQLELLADHLRPLVNERFRTRPDRDNTALIGSSMGGLFSFHAAWTRSDLFSKAACLSSSFWWADREAVRRVQQGKAPDPRPLLYLDSGASHSPLEQDASARDGFHHTRAMFRALVTQGYTPGVDLHRLTFPGSTHDAASWAARIALPLQLLFPREVREPAAEIFEAAAQGELEPEPPVTAVG